MICLAPLHVQLVALWPSLWNFSPLWHLPGETLFSQHEDRVWDNNTIYIVCCSQSLSSGCPIAFWSLWGTHTHWVNDINIFRTLRPGSNWYIELWALFVCFWLFHKFLTCLPIEICLLIFCLLTQSPQICMLFISAGSVSLPGKKSYFLQLLRFYWIYSFSDTWFKLLDKTNPNIRDVNTFPPQAAGSISCIYSLFLSPSQFF